MRQASDRNPEEARAIIVLMFVWAFWKKDYMSVSLRQFHRAFRSVLRTLKEAGVEEKDVENLGFIYDSNRSDAISINLNVTLHHLQKKGILCVSADDADENVEFNLDTRKRLQHELAETYHLEASENRMLSEICDKAVLLYQSNVRKDNDCNE